MGKLPDEPAERIAARRKIRELIETRAGGRQENCIARGGDAVRYFDSCRKVCNRKDLAHSVKGGLEFFGIFAEDRNTFELWSNRSCERVEIATFSLPAGEEDDRTVHRVDGSYGCAYVRRLRIIDVANPVYLTNELHPVR